MMVVADRLKMSMVEVLNMSLIEYNTWLGYLLDEQDMIESEKRKSMHRKQKADLKINEVYTEALLNYSAYKAHGAISGDMKDENNNQN